MTMRRTALHVIDVDDDDDWNKYRSVWRFGNSVVSTISLLQPPVAFVVWWVVVNFGLRTFAKKKTLYIYTTYVHRNVFNDASHTAGQFQNAKCNHLVEIDWYLYTLVLFLIKPLLHPLTKRLIAYCAVRYCNQFNPQPRNTAPISAR